METARSLRFDRRTDKAIRKAATAANMTVSDYIRDAVRRRMLVDELEQMSDSFTRAAARKGLVTDDDFDQAMTGNRKRRCA